MKKEKKPPSLAYQPGRMAKHRQLKKGLVKRIFNTFAYMSNITFATKSHSQLKEPSEAEAYIIDFLKYYGIKFQREVTIINLKNDTKKYRVADFYLPKYKTLIEFNGEYNKEDQRSRYIEKKIVYDKNNIPCVHLYPENLSFLPFCFDKRLQKVLESKKMRKELLKYRFYKFIYGEGFRLILISIFTYLSFIFYFGVPKDPNLSLVCLIGTIYQTIKTGNSLNLIFKKNQYPLSIIKPF